MSEEVYLYDLGWYHVHDNLGCVKGAFALKDSISVEEYEELIKETYHILTTKKEIERLHSIIKEVRECIDHYAIENEDFSKFYNNEEIEILKIIESDKE